MRESTSFLQRGVFPKVLLPSNHSVTAFPSSQLEFSRGTTQHTSQTHLVPTLPGESKMVAGPSASQPVGHTKQKATAIATVGPGHTMLLTDQTVVVQKAFTQPKLLEGETKIPKAIKATEAALRITSNRELPNRQRTTPVVPAVTERNEEKAVFETTTEYSVWLRTQAATQRANSTDPKNTTSGGQSTTPMPTIPAGPTLAPKPSPAATGAYNVSNGPVDCIKALVGLTMVCFSPPNRLEYFNVNPNNTHTTGSCGIWLSTLNVSFPGGFIDFSFSKVIQSDQFVSYKNYCESRSHLHYTNILVLPAENECVLDRNERLIPIAISLSIVGLFVIMLVTCMLYRRKPSRGYEQI
uniref:Lysosomal associated membrane protein 3 n=1 Tax=Salvator merianae TaxID=96440 RepID=A0A8D0EE41_SALMN